jgi:GT2 family glycosyltransferase
VRNPLQFLGEKTLNMNPKVAVIVLSWNGKELTLACIESLTASDYPHLDIYLVDNASTDGTVESVEAAFGEQIRLIVNHENLGFAGGNNVGIRQALEEGAEYVLLLNNDTTVARDMISQMVTAAGRNPRMGIFGPKIFYESPPDQIWFAGGDVLLARGVTRHIGIREKDRGQYDIAREVSYASGCALMVRRDVIDEIGVLDETYEMYFEDTDFCMRAQLAGFGCYYVPLGRMWHKISPSTGGQMSRRKINRKLKSSWIFFRRYAKPHHWITIPIFFIIDAVRIVLLIAAGKIRNT